jgi:hypothetical protein
LYLEKYFPLLVKDIDDVTDVLAQSLPDAVRMGLESELKKLQALNAVLSGEGEKSVLHQLRANLRWARQRVEKEKDPHKRKEIEREVHAIESEIEKETEKRGGGLISGQRRRS